MRKCRIASVGLRLAGLWILVGACDLAVAAVPDCHPSPLGERALFLRGSFNGWGAADAQRFRYVCNRYELVTSLAGDASFKVADEAWSSDADLGAAEGVTTFPVALSAHGANLQYAFHGTYRFVLTMPNDHAPATLDVAQCPEPPLGNEVLYLRGSMNNWSALDPYAFKFSCDAYYLNVRLQAGHEFKVADADWSAGRTFGAASTADAALVESQPVTLVVGGNTTNLHFGFAGEQTLRLAFPGGQPMLSVGPKSFADPAATSVDDQVALSIRFDSRNAANKWPFGAVTTGTPVEFTVTSDAGVENMVLLIEERRLEGNQDLLEYRPVARLPMHKKVAAGTAAWSAAFTFDHPAVYGYSFEAEVSGRAYRYQNNRHAIYWTREQGSNGLGQVEREGEPVRRFRQTVYAPDFVVPSWAQDAVYYYIFPDRYRNGDPANDPQPGQRTYQDKPIELHRHWLDKPWRPNSGDGSDEVYNNDFFGGDLQGIIDKLDDIAELGANTLYITPLFTAASNHKYDTADYRNIDPGFGSNEDFKRLTSEAAKRGMRVVPDASLNHTGSDSIYFDRYGKYPGVGAFEGGHIRPDSPYADWYRFDLSQADPDKQFHGWVGVRDLPELNKTSPSFRRFAFGDDDSVMKLWLDRGAAGWRMDVAPWVPDDFWRDWRQAIRGHRPDAITIAEAWFDSSKFFLGDMFDSTMNYIFRNAVIDYANGGSARDAYRQIEFMREAYPPQAFAALMNLVSSHDVPRALYLFGYHEEGDMPEAIALAKQRLRLALLFQVALPGSPAIYYGDEVGVTGREDPYNRATYPWADLGGHPDELLRADFKRMLGVRRDHEVLRRGTLSAPLYLDDHVIVILRQLGDQVAIIALNNADTSQAVTIPLPETLQHAAFADALEQGNVSAQNGRLLMDVPAHFGRILFGPAN